jgi:hypothetical protein
VADPAAQRVDTVAAALQTTAEAHIQVDREETEETEVQEEDVLQFSGRGRTL